MNIHVQVVRTYIQYSAYIWNDSYYILVRTCREAASDPDSIYNPI